jgi:glycosyltransferase involved in cell wall biosynthesis
MPAYNAETYILQAIDSVRAQTYRNWELIIVDDGSTDNTAKIVNEEKIKEERIIYLYQKNKRLGAARNTGIMNSKGTWIAFLDADDLWANDKLHRQMLVASKTPDVDVIYTDGYIFYGDDLKNLEPYPVKVGNFSGEVMYKIQFEANYIPVLSVVVKKSLINKIGFQEENPLFYGCEDWDFWLRMTKANANFVGMPDKLFYYRKHNNNMSLNVLSMDLARAMVLVKNFEKEKFSDTEIRKIFKPFVNPLLISLLNNNKPKEAVALMKKLQDKIPIFYFRISYICLKLFKKKSLLAIKAVNKFDTLIFR